MGHDVAMGRLCRALQFITQTRLISGWRYSARMDTQNLPTIRIPAEVSQGDRDEKDREDSKISPAPGGEELVVRRCGLDWGATWEDVGLRGHWVGLVALRLSQGAWPLRLVC